MMVALHTGVKVVTVPKFDIKAFVPLIVKHKVRVDTREGDNLLPERSNTISSVLDRSWSTSFSLDQFRESCKLTIKANCEIAECFRLCLMTQMGSHSLSSKDNSSPSHKTTSTYYTYTPFT
ncbi:hypothetical protein E2C01_100580 [Portunus trituberculatus]|uniref:Uncharacterized protein n=1 Tax=Portunus trituberculatus TaxID=210409 RepID=A0A5B7KIB2_PORTR|nr:hypothetical protein [Portunus trituberculatus]